MNLEKVHSTVRAALARGNTLDNSIPGMVEQAARWIERNQSYKHMERFAVKAPEYTDDRTLDLPAKRIKNVRFMRVKQAGCYKYITRVDPSDIRAPSSVGRPSHYWRANEKHLILDAPARDLEIEVGWYAYTPWPAPDDLTASNWLIENASDALVAQTMILFAGELLSPKLRQLFEPQRTEALRTLNIAFEEEEYSDTDNVMRFT